jgi:hypothetical protein
MVYELPPAAQVSSSSWPAAVPASRMTLEAWYHRAAPKLGDADSLKLDERLELTDSEVDGLRLELRESLVLGDRLSEVDGLRDELADGLVLGERLSEVEGLRDGLRDSEEDPSVSG